MAYGQIGSEASLEELSHSSGVSRSNISRNNAFLTAIGVVEGGQKKGITSLGAQLARALDHGIDSEITRSWREIVEGTEFLSKMVSAVRIRKGMDPSSLVSHIAYSAGESKSSRVATGARAIVDILVSSGLLQPDGDHLAAAATPAPTSGPASGSEPPAETIKSGPILVSGSAVTLHVELRINAEPDQLEGLGEAIRDLLRQLSLDSGQPEA